MSEERRALREVAWQEVFPWLNLCTAVRLALRPQLLVLAAMGLIATTAGWRLAGQAFSGTENKALAEAIRVDGTWPWNRLAAHGSSDATDIVPSIAGYAPLIEFAPNELKYQTRPFRRLFSSDATFTTCVYSTLCCLWSLVVWALFGGAITRHAAVALARQDRLSWSQSIGYARGKWISYFTAPLYPLVGVLLLALPVLLIGLLLNFAVGTVLAGLLWPIVLAVGFLMALLLVGLLAGWPLMWSTISAEGTDAFDALSRCYSYVFQRPLHYLFYALVAGVLGTAAWLVVCLLAGGTLNLAHWAAGWGAGDDMLRLSGNGPFGSIESVGAGLIRLFEHGVRTLAAAFATSLVWTASTAAYFLLRQNVDATELDEVFLPDEDEQYSLPPLGGEGPEAPATGAAG